MELPAIYREPVILRDFKGLSTEEASAKLRVKDQTLKSRLHRGRCCCGSGWQILRTGSPMRRYVRIVVSKRTRSRAESAGVTSDDKPGGLQRDRHHRRSTGRSLVTADGDERRVHARRARQRRAHQAGGRAAKRVGTRRPQSRDARVEPRQLRRAQHFGRGPAGDRGFVPRHDDLLRRASQHRQRNIRRRGAGFERHDRGDRRSQRLRRRAEQPHPRDAKLVDAAFDQTGLRRAGADDRRELVEAGDALDERKPAFVFPLGDRIGRRRRRSITTTAPTTAATSAVPAITV